MVTYISCSFIQAALEPAKGGKWCCCFQCSVGREAFHGLGVQDVAEFDSDWCSVFGLLGEERKEKKIIKRKEKRPEAVHALWLYWVGFLWMLGAING
jgi:hypothetical protein